MKRRAIIVGSGSDIYQQIRPLMLEDGWQLDEWKRGEPPLDPRTWDLVLVTIGRIAPVDMWWRVSSEEALEAMASNVMLPFRALQEAWPWRRADATVVFFAGSNPNMIMDGYTAYNISKMALLKLVEQLDHETPDAKFVALGPGIVLTRIHDQSDGWDNAKLAAARAAGKSTDPARIWECIKWIHGAPKDIVGGRNICVSDAWHNGALNRELASDSRLFKLGRKERTL